MDSSVDFDDVLASLRSGTFGLTLPFSVSQQDVIVPIPATPFEISNQFFHVNLTPLFQGDVVLQHFQGELGGQLVMDLGANIQISADLFATAFQANAINVVPEPSSWVLAVVGGAGLLLIARRARPEAEVGRLRKYSPRQFARNVQS